MFRGITDKRRALAMGCGTHAVQDGLTAATFVLLPIIAQAFGFSYAQVGLFKGLKSFAQGGLELTSGLLSERIGEGRVLVFGLVLAGLGYALLSLATGPGLVLAALLITGMGGGFHHAPASALVNAAYIAGGRRGALGLYNSAGDVGKLAFAAGFSLAIGAGAAWQGITFFYGACALAAAGAIGFSLRRLRLPEVAQTRTDPGRGWGILNPRAFATLLVVVSLVNVVQAGVLVFVAFLMIAKGLSLYLATLAAVMVLAGGILGKAGCGYLAERIGVRSAFTAVQVLTALGLVCVALAPGWLAFALLLPLGVVSQGSTSITYGLVPEMIAAGRVARGYALMYSATSFASALGPFAFGLLADRYGIGASVTAMAGVAALAVPPIYLLPTASPKTA